MPSPSEALCSLPITASGVGNASGNGNGSSILSPKLNVNVNLFSKTTTVTPPPKSSFDSTGVLVTVGAAVVGGIVVAASLKYGETKQQGKKPARVGLSLDQTLASQLMGTAKQNRF
jgi:hypothetical protein